MAVARVSMSVWGKMIQFVSVGLPGGGRAASHAFWKEPGFLPREGMSQKLLGCPGCSAGGARHLYTTVAWQAERDAGFNGLNRSISQDGGGGCLG